MKNATRAEQQQNDPRPNDLVYKRLLICSRCCQSAVTVSLPVFSVACDEVHAVMRQMFPEDLLYGLAFVGFVSCFSDFVMILPCQYVHYTRKYDMYSMLFGVYSYSVQQ